MLPCRAGHARIVLELLHAARFVAARRESDLEVVVRDGGVRTPRHIDQRRLQRQDALAFDEVFQDLGGKRQAARSLVERTGVPDPRDDR